MLDYRVRIIYDSCRLPERRRCRYVPRSVCVCVYVYYYIIIGEATAVVGNGRRGRARTTPLPENRTCTERPVSPLPTSLLVRLTPFRVTYDFFISPPSRFSYFSNGSASWVRLPNAGIIRFSYGRVSSKTPNRNRVRIPNGF